MAARTGSLSSVSARSGGLGFAAGAFRFGFGLDFFALRFAAGAFRFRFGLDLFFALGFRLAMFPPVRSVELEHSNLGRPLRDATLSPSPSRTHPPSGR